MPLSKNKPIFSPVPDVRVFTSLPTRADTVYLGQKQGVTVDAYRDKIRDGRSASSNYTMNAVKIEKQAPMNLTHSATFVQTVDSSTGKIFGAPIVNRLFGYYLSMPGNGYAHQASVSAALEAEALSRLYSKIRSEYEHMNSLVVLGELRETIRMIRNPASALREGTSRFLNSVKSTREEVRQRVRPRKSDGVNNENLARRRRQAVVDSVSGSWLEWQFGAVPLINDVKDAAELLGRALHGTEARSRVSGTSSTARGSALVAFGDTALNDPVTGIRYNRRDTTEASVRYIAGLKSHLNGPATSVSELARVSGVAISNFVPTAYQLMPYSFLIDYFVNLGDVLEAWFTDTSSVYYVTKTSRQKTEINVTENAFIRPQSSGVAPGKYVTTGFVGQSQSQRILTRTTLTREALSGVPMPPLVASIPGIDSTKWFNMAALLTQAKAFRF